MQLYMTADNISEFDIAVSVESRSMWQAALFHLTEHLTEGRWHLHMLHKYFAWINI